MGGFTGNPEKYAFTHYQSLLGNTQWVGDAFHILKLNIYIYIKNEKKIFVMNKEVRTDIRCWQKEPLHIHVFIYYFNVQCAT